LCLGYPKGAFMPKQRYQRREPTHDWQQIRPLLKDTAQIVNAKVLLAHPTFW